jgi:hypothetical protein
MQRMQQRPGSIHYTSPGFCHERRPRHLTPIFLKGQFPTFLFHFRCLAWSDPAPLQASPWKTIANVNASSFKPGDQILFKRGEDWRVNYGAAI